MYSTGAHKSPYDPRTYSYQPPTAPQKGGDRYAPEDIKDQHRVGICTSISGTQLFTKVKGKEYSPEFQYVVQKLFIDGNWNEGSSILSSLRAAKKYGLLPQELWTYTDDEDRKLPYSKYVKKLQAVPITDIMELMKKTDKIIDSYAKLTDTGRDTLANAIHTSDAGILARFELGEEWWTNPIEPLRPPKELISGHAVIISNFDGNSFRIANTWGDDWSDNGTAYFIHRDYKPTEAWSVFFEETPEEVNTKPTIHAIIDLIIKIYKMMHS